MWPGPWQPLKQLIWLRWKSPKPATLVQPVTWIQLSCPGTRSDSPPRSIPQSEAWGRQSWREAVAYAVGEETGWEAGSQSTCKGRGQEVEGESQERNRAAHEGGRKHEQPQQGAKLHSLVSSEYIRSFSFSPKVHQLHPGLSARALGPWSVCYGDGIRWNWKLPTFH